jgi:hypothetical protein
MKQRCFVMEYTLDYQHRVQVGVKAKSPEEAEQKAQQAFDSGTIWDDTAEMPLLFDDYEETEDNVLAFKSVAEVGKWPTPDASVEQLRRNAIARLACQYLVDEVKASKVSGRPVNWKKAYEAALVALGML